MGRAQGSLKVNRKKVTPGVPVSLCLILSVSFSEESRCLGLGSAQWEPEVSPQHPTSVEPLKHCSPPSPL